MQVMNGTANVRVPTRGDHMPYHPQPVAAERAIPHGGCTVRNDLHASRRLHEGGGQNGTPASRRQAGGPRPVAGDDHAMEWHSAGWVAMALEAVGSAVAARDWEGAETLIDQLKSVWAGGERTSPSGISSPSLRQDSDDPGELPLEPLRVRELEVLTLVAAGYSNQDIADQLIVSVGTVRWHLKNIYSKLDVHSRTQAIARVRAQGLLN